MRLRVVAVAALMAACWVVPGLSGLVAGLHLHVGHEHAQPRSAEALESLLHGHFHDAATPEHTHAFWFSPPAPRPARADTAAVAPAIEASPLPSDRPVLASSRSVDELGERSAPVSLSLLHCALLS